MVLCSPEGAGEAKDERRREVKHNQKESAGELMNELLISIEIAGLRN